MGAIEQEDAVKLVIWTERSFFFFVYEVSKASGRGQSTDTGVANCAAWLWR